MLMSFSSGSHKEGWLHGSLETRNPGGLGNPMGQAWAEKSRGVYRCFSLNLQAEPLCRRRLDICVPSRIRSNLTVVFYLTAKWDRMALGRKDLASKLEYRILLPKRGRLSWANYILLMSQGRIFFPNILLLFCFMFSPLAYFYFYSGIETHTHTEKLKSIMKKD